MEQTMLIAVLIAALVGLFLFDTVRLRRMQMQVHKTRRDDFTRIVERCSERGSCRSKNRVFVAHQSRDQDTDERDRGGNGVRT